MTLLALVLLPWINSCTPTFTNCPPAIIPSKEAQAEHHASEKQFPNLWSYNDKVEGREIYIVNGCKL